MDARCRPVVLGAVMAALALSVTGGLTARAVTGAEQSRRLAMTVCGPDRVRASVCRDVADAGRLPPSLPPPAPERGMSD